ncbi:MAG TPA: helix-turn-helix domain-containing protein [Burkholderiaceae bacterium]|nr:helix-turn-helix domain-containing protein [Burkholderiaceae bacterium]
MKNLPRVARDLVDLVGMTAALALINAFPGVAIEVPRGVRDSPMQRRLRLIMGVEAADVFIQHHAGNPFRVPMCKAAMRDAKHAEIIAQVDAGKPVWKVAIENGMHERTVWRILKRCPGEAVPGLGQAPDVPDSQMPLF